MADSEQEQSKGRASTSLGWHYGGKECMEVFVLETRINGNLSEAELET